MPPAEVVWYVRPPSGGQYGPAKDDLMRTWIAEGRVGGGANATADGKYICTGHREDLSDRIVTDLGHGYVGFQETWEAHPHSAIVKIPIDGGAPETVYEENYWLGHFNASPNLPNIVTFCHEGPWRLVENRIWGLDLNTGEAWQRACAQVAQRLQRAVGEGYAEDAADERQHHALGEHLPDEPPARRAQRDAHRDLSLASRGPGEEQRRDVGAGDEQH